MALQQRQACVLVTWNFHVEVQKFKSSGPAQPRMCKFHLMGSCQCLAGAKFRTRVATSLEVGHEVTSVGAFRRHGLNVEGVLACQERGAMPICTRPKQLCSKRWALFGPRSISTIIFLAACYLSGELQGLPDLARTKICKQMIQTGRCEDTLRVQAASSAPFPLKQIR